MTVMDAVPTVSNCFDSGVVLTVLSDGKLSITGNKKAPVVSDLVALINQDRQIVLAAIETVNMQRMSMAGWNATVAARNAPVAPEQKTTSVKSVTEVPAPPDLFAASENIVEHSIQPEAVALDVAASDLQLFVGRIVSDDDMDRLYYRAHMEGARLTSDWMGKRLPCDHKVTSWRAGGVK